MAENSHQSRTEQPTPHRIERSREKGQVPYSTDLTAGLALLLISLALWLSGPGIVDVLMSSAKSIINACSWIARRDIDAERMVMESVSPVAWVAVPILAGTFLLPLISGGLLTGFRFSFDPLNMDANKLDPKKGFTRIFSTRSLMRGLMAIAKAGVLTAVVFWILNIQSDEIRLAGTMSLPGSLTYAWSIVIQMFLAVAAALLLIGGVDYLYQRWKHLQDLRMTRQELVDERKDTEGDPHIRARLRRLQRELSQRRMINDVGDATVVVTNPTHYAVALKYDSATMANPKVVAKGSDLLAKIITAKARRHAVPIVERKPLARYLYKNVAVGQDIPVDVFQAVAEVLVYVYNLNNNSAA